MYYVYILKSLINGSYYIGSCKDITERLRLHNLGKVSSTVRYRPWQLMYKEVYNTLSEARRREKQIKAWKKRRAIKNLINRGSTTPLVGS